MSVKEQTNKKSCCAESGRMNREMRRQQIVNVGMRLFAERGFRGTTTKDIASESHVSEAVVFQHFKTKAELYTAILDEKASQAYDGQWLTEVNDFIAREDDEGLLNFIARRILEYCRKDPDFLRLMLYSALEGHELAATIRQRMLRPVFELLREYIERRQRQGYFERYSTDAAAFAFLGTQIYYAMVRNLFNGTMLTLPEDEAIENFTRLSLNGLSCRTFQNSNKNFVGKNKSKDLHV